MFEHTQTGSFLRSFGSTQCRHFHFLCHAWVLQSLQSPLKNTQVNAHQPNQREAHAQPQGITGCGSHMPMKVRKICTDGLLHKISNFSKVWSNILTWGLLTY